MKGKKAQYVIRWIHNKTIGGKNIVSQHCCVLQIACADWGDTGKHFWYKGQGENERGRRLENNNKVQIMKSQYGVR
jgi:hypothetical protein